MGVLKAFFLRLIANGLGLWISARLVPGIDYGGTFWVIVIAAIVFSLINMLIKPILVILSLPALILTLGLFMLVINSLMLYLVTVIYPSFSVTSFGAAILAVIIIWLANIAISTLFDRD